MEERQSCCRWGSSRGAMGRSRFRSDGWCSANVDVSCRATKCSISDDQISGAVGVVSPASPTAARKRLAVDFSESSRISCHWWTAVGAVLRRRSRITAAVLISTDRNERARVSACTGCRGSSASRAARSARLSARATSADEGSTICGCRYWSMSSPTRSALVSSTGS